MIRSCVRVRPAPNPVVFAENLISFQVGVMLPLDTITNFTSYVTLSMVTSAFGFAFLLPPLLFAWLKPAPFEAPSLLPPPPNAWGGDPTGGSHLRANAVGKASGETPQIDTA
jgi:hypothetical protein